MNSFRPGNRQLRVPRALRVRLERSLTIALEVPPETVDQRLAELDQQFPNATDEQLRELDRWYVTLATSSAGRDAGVINRLVRGPSAAESDGFAALTGVYVAARGQMHGVDVRDSDCRKLLILAAMVGPANCAAVGKVGGLSGQNWGRALAEDLPPSWIAEASDLLMAQFLTRYGMKKAAMAIGQQLPLFGRTSRDAGYSVIARGAVQAMGEAFGSSKG